jgi:hypothetical protein
MFVSAEKQKAETNWQKVKLTFIMLKIELLKK